MENGYYHTPVMLKEALDGLKLSQGGIPRPVVVDATCGEGGHSMAIAPFVKAGRLICIDRNPAVLERARKRLEGFSNVSFHNRTFDGIAAVLKEEGLETADGVLADLGVSMFHFKDGAASGFSYTDETGLDMRLDGPDTGKASAGQVLNRCREQEIADILYRYGEEKEARKIAKAITQSRPINNARELSELVLRVKRRGRGRTHPATQTFQALRIFVNDELSLLEKFVPIAASCTRTGGRLVIISYHSLEDRIVKQGFKKMATDGIGSIITKKPLTPSQDEMRENKASRSAKLRIFETGSPPDE